MENIIQKIESSQRLTLADGLNLYENADLLLLGKLADQVNYARNQSRVFFCINSHIHYSNICRVRCGFCGFCRQAADADSYVRTAEQIAHQACQAQQHGATEVHIVGGIHPELPVEYYLELVTQVKRRCPNLHIKAFTATEIIDIAQKGNASLRDTLTQLKDCGLGSLTGGGAEILDDDYFARHCRDKSSPAQWLEVHRQAHRLGISSNATMLFGLDESPAQCIEHLLTLRNLQDESQAIGRGQFRCFVPLPYIAEQSTPGACPPEPIDAQRVLKTMALSRLMLDNVAHIKAFWPMLGVKLAQVALGFGADDLDGTVKQYSIVRPQENGKHNNFLDRQRLISLIQEADKKPVCRGDISPTTMSSDSRAK